MASRLAAGVCAWAVFALVGCGKSEGGAKPIPQSELASRVADLLCDSLAGCCSSSGFAIDTAGCKAARAAALQDDFTEQEGAVRYDAQAAGDCLAAAALKIQCGQVDDDDAPACERVFVGTVALGQPCESSRECAPVAGRSVHCDSDGLSPGVCLTESSETTPHGKAGDACSLTCFEGEDCGGESVPVPQPAPGDEPAAARPLVACYRDDGLYCTTSGSGSCARLRALGASCDLYDACVGTAFCNFDTGICTAPQPNGSPCVSSEQCQSGRCGEQANAAPNATGEIPRFCGAAPVVTAEKCDRASKTDAPDSSAPAGDPGTSAGAP